VGLLRRERCVSIFRADNVEPNDGRTDYRVRRRVGLDGALLRRGAAQKASAPKPQDKLALGEEEVKQSLLLIDTERKGKISKQEWMKFMEAEFDRLDKTKNGGLDIKELTQSRLRVTHFASVGK
jgi:EF hand